MFILQRSVSKEKVKEFFNSVLRRIEGELPRVIENKIMGYMKTINSIIEELETPVYSVKEFINYLTSHARSTKVYQENNYLLVQINDLISITQSDKELAFKIKINESLKQNIQKMQQNKDKLNRLIEETNEKMDIDKQKFKIQLNQQIPYITN